ncbi:MAG TPA: hypothetical protein VNM45_20865 [Bacillus sp. (in: firmicutes)]|nr:hypothetical protein [Bacillus sp. (in: firmicutes)]
MALENSLTQKILLSYLRTKLLVHIEQEVWIFSTNKLPLGQNVDFERVLGTAYLLASFKRYLIEPLTT